MNLYRFKIFSIMGVLSSAIQGMPFSGYADKDTCGPSFSTMHEFKVGVVFERYSLMWSMEVGGRDPFS